MPGRYPCLGGGWGEGPSLYIVFGTLSMMDGRQDGECFYQVLQQTRRWHLVHLSSLDILDQFYFPIYFNACPQNVFVACFAVVCKSMILLVSGAELIPAEGPPPPAIVTAVCPAPVPHHPIIRDQCWPSLLTTIHLLKYLKYWNLCWTRPGLATMMLRSVVVSLDVKFRILQPPSSSYPGPSLYSVSSFWEMWDGCQPNMKWLESPQSTQPFLIDIG